MKTLLLLSISFLFIKGAIAAPGNPDSWCRNGAFPKEGPDFRIAEVKGEKGSRIYFLGDQEGYPSEKNPQCKAKAYLIPGDKVIVARRYQSWVCSWFEPTPRKKGVSETVGWLLVNALQIPVSNPSAESKDWVGLRRYAENTITIKQEVTGGSLMFSGEATWKGMGKNIHNGAASGSFHPRGNTFSLPEDEDGCVVEGFLVPPFLIVSDNLKCGGMNVSFSGVYRK